MKKKYLGIILFSVLSKNKNSIPHVEKTLERSK